MYLGAEHLIGFFTIWPSAQWYSYFGPADIMGHRSSVQNSVIVPYNMLIWLKKSTVFTATHSSTSSPSGSWTASLKFPTKMESLLYLERSWELYECQTWSQSCISMFHEVMLMRSFGDIFLGLKRLWGPTTAAKYENVTIPMCKFNDTVYSLQVEGRNETHSLEPSWSIC